MKTVFFTGATGGLGELCVKSLAKRQWTVFAAGTNEQKLKELSKIINIIPVKINITSMDSIQAAHDLVLKYTDRLDAIVNFVGLTAFTSLIEGDVENAVERLLDVNVMGAVRVNKEFFNLIEKGNGRIINCSSSVGWMKAQPFSGPYTMSKYALEAYNDSLRRELICLGIPVIKIQPGSFKTNITGVIANDFNKTLAITTRYKYVLNKMKPMMDSILKHSGNPERLIAVVTKALESKNPRLQYRVCSGVLLSLMEIMSEKGVDSVYKILFKGK